MLAKLPTRERIFSEAVRLFGERGYHETTVGDIEGAVGLTPRAGGFYRHFASKEAVLVEAVGRIADEMIAEVRLAEIVKLKSAHAELLVIARALIRHAETYRSLRLLVQREGHKLRALRKMAAASNKRLASVDLVPWVEDMAKRSGRPVRNPREMALVIFGPIMAQVLAFDRGERAFGADPEAFLETWASHWAAWFEAGPVPAGRATRKA
jgi:AcrR family transcriptional regulator